MSNQTNFTMQNELQKKRLKAVETLQMYKNRSNEEQTLSGTCRSFERSPKTPGMNGTDYITLGSYKTLNITDLQTDKTIMLDSTDKRRSTVQNKVSFEPSEITGRSTLYRSDLSKKCNEISVEEILATSCSGDVRNLSTLFRKNNTNKEKCDQKTANNIQLSADSFSLHQRLKDFSFTSQTHQFDEFDENFIPAELMNSKLANDEKSWAQEYAAIPTKYVEPVKNDENKDSENMSINSNLYRNVSEIADFFDETPDDFTKLLGKHSSPERHNPIALYEKTTINDGKTDESTNKEDSSYLLSLSSIAKALDKIKGDESGKTLINRFLAAKKSSNKSNNTSSFYKTHTEKDKENIDPSNDTTLENTSFMESFLCTSGGTNDSLSSRISNQSSTKGNVGFKTFDKTNAKDDQFKFGNNSNLSNIQRSKSPSNPRELYATAGLSSSNVTNLCDKNNSRKRSHSASRNQVQITNPTICLQELQKLNKQEKLKENTLKKIDNDSGNVSLNKHLSSPRIEEPHKNFKFTSPISKKDTPERDQTTNLSLSSLYNSPQFLTSSKKLDNSPLSDRQYLTTTNSIATSPGSEYVGKLSLPNYDMLGQIAMRSTSQSSTSSEFSHRVGKVLPIKVTCLQFSWGSVKLRTNSTKSLQIKNFSVKRLVLKVQISGPGFQILNLETNSIITLQAQECRTIDVNFCPTVIGVAVGQIMFSSPFEHSSSTLRIPLHGYGGHAVIIPQGFQKGPIGLPFLTMGELHELSEPLTRTFNIYNKGPLNAFAFIYLNSMDLDLPRLSECIEIIPKMALIQSGQTVTFRITFKPRRDDLKRIIKKIKEVMILSKMQIITGDGPTRQRIRNIIAKMTEKEKSYLASNLLQSCWSEFPSEHTINDVKNLNEQPEVALELLSMFRSHEIAITLNHTVLDDTVKSMNLMFPDIDETIMFRTIASNTLCSNVLENDLENIQENIETGKMWSVRPNILQINPYDKKSKSTLTITNSYKTSQYFEISANYKQLFVITPNAGQLTSGHSIDITISSTETSFLPTDDIFITVFVENEKVIIPVRMKRMNFLSNAR